MQFERIAEITAERLVFKRFFAAVIRVNQYGGFGMSVWEWISGILLLVTGIFLIVVVMLQESKQNGLSGSISGGNTESYMDRTGGGRTKEQMLKRLTKIAAIVFFVLVLAVNLAVLFQ